MIQRVTVTPLTRSRYETILSMISVQCTNRGVNDEAGPGENYEQYAGYEGLIDG